MPRFHLDESVTTAIADGLRLRGYDCTTTAELKMIAASDEEQAAFAKTADRIIITADQDFLRMSAVASDHPGVVFWTKRHHFGRLIAFVDELCLSSPDNLPRGQVHFF